MKSLVLGLSIFLAHNVAANETTASILLSVYLEPAPKASLPDMNRETCTRSGSKSWCRDARADYSIEADRSQERVTEASVVRITVSPI